MNCFIHSRRASSRTHNNLSSSLLNICKYFTFFSEIFSQWLGCWVQALHGCYCRNTNTVNSWVLYKKLRREIICFLDWFFVAIFNFFGLYNENRKKIVLFSLSLLGRQKQHPTQSVGALGSSVIRRGTMEVELITIEMKKLCSFTPFCTFGLSFPYIF